MDCRLEPKRLTVVRIKSKCDFTGRRELVLRRTPIGSFPKRVVSIDGIQPAECFYKVVPHRLDKALWKTEVSRFFRERLSDPVQILQNIRVGLKPRAIRGGPEINKAFLRVVHYLGVPRSAIEHLHARFLTDWAMVAGEGNDQHLRVGEITQRMGLAIDARKLEIGS